MLASANNQTTEDRTEVISSQRNIFDLKLSEIWDYRDLLVLFVRRDFVITYKQTILGPIWFFLQPVLTTIIFVLIFSRIAGLSTDGIPALPFYLAGVVLWNYLSECITRTSSVFRDNASMFGKVYFPRLIMPIAIVISALVKLMIQLLLFALIWIYYFWRGEIYLNEYALLSPLLILILAAIGLGLGMIISALTTRYRDLAYLLTFGIQLAMYATPIIYPLSSINSDFRHILIMNPICGIIEIFRFGFLGSGTFTFGMLLYSAIFAFSILVGGALLYNRAEKNFMDTI